MQLERELIELAREAGMVLLGLWPGGISKVALEIREKADGSQVTNADILSNEIIVRGLRRLCPTDRIVSEEGPQEYPTDPQQILWYVDPLDGTSAFVRGEPDFSTLIARERAGVLDFSCLFFPARDQCAWAMQGRGAHLNGKRLAVSSRESLGTRTVHLRNLPALDNAKVNRDWMDFGSAFLGLCLGEIDGIVLKFRGHQIWDLAAPSLLVQESGGIVTDELGQPIAYDGATPRSSYLVASNGHTHTELLNLVFQKDDR